MAKKTYTDEEISAMTDEEVAALGIKKEDDSLTDEQREELAEMGEPNSPERKSLYQRFKKVNERSKSLERELAEERAKNGERTDRLLEHLTREPDKKTVEEEQPPKPPAAFDFVGARAKRRALFTKGEFEDAAEIEDAIAAAEQAKEDHRDAMDAYRERRTEARIKKASDDAASTALDAAEARRVQNEANAAARRMYKKYPFLNHEDADADDDAIAAVKSRRDALTKGGMGIAEAIEQACEEKGPKFAKLHEAEGGGKKGDDDDEPKKGETRAAAAIRKAAEAANKQPPNTKTLGKGGKQLGKLNIHTMTDEQLAKLSDEEMAEIDGSTRVDDE